MAHAVRIHEFGGPEVLKIEDVPVPEPGAGEVRLRVKAIGLNRYRGDVPIWTIAGEARPALADRFRGGW